MTRRSLSIGALFGLMFPLAIGAPSEGHAQPLQRAGGELRPAGTPPEAPFDTIGSEPLGNFVVESAGAGDLRTTPGTVTFTTPGGSLTAEARRSNETNVDPVSGRPRRAGAVGECNSPDDPACLGFVSNPASPSGNWFTDLDNDGLPERAPDPSLPPNFVPVTVPAAHAADLAASRPANADAFAALCDFSRDSVPALNTARCLLDFLNNQNFLGPLRISQYGGGLLAGSPIAALATEIAVIAGVPAPVVRLNNDPNDDPLGIDGGVLPTRLPALGSQGYGQVSTAWQEALSGCGPFHGTDCDDDGAGLLDAQPTALLQSWPILAGLSSDWRMDFGDPALANPQPMPGTVGFAGESPCLREQAGTVFVLPGCRGPFYNAATLTGSGGPLEGLTVVGDWDPLVDGCVDPASDPACLASNSGAGARTLVIPDVDLDGDGSSGDFGASTGQAFVSEMAALSWNALLTFVVLSSIPDLEDNTTGGPGSDGFADRPPLPDEFDTFNAPNGPGLTPGDPGYDPATMGPLRLNGCSYLRPQLCKLVSGLASHSAAELDDDPSGRPQRRWLWETGAEYEVTEASGDLAGFSGWSLHALGPERSRVSEGDAGVAFLLAPPDGPVLPPDSLLVRRNPGPDGIVGTADDLVLGAAYGVVLPTVDVVIDIGAGPRPARINPRNRGVVSVKIFGSDTFDVAGVDATTLAFGPGEASLAHRNGPHAADLNGDGLTDLLAHFRTQETGIAAGDEEACLTGELLDGTPFEGCDSVRTVPPR